MNFGEGQKSVFDSGRAVAPPDGDRIGASPDGRTVAPLDVVRSVVPLDGKTVATPDCGRTVAPIYVDRTGASLDSGRLHHFMWWLKCPVQVGL
jgi:hypothetical protein